MPYRHSGPEHNQGPNPAARKKRVRQGVGAIPATDGALACEGIDPHRARCPGRYQSRSHTRLVVKTRFQGDIPSASVFLVG